MIVNDSMRGRMEEWYIKDHVQRVKKVAAPRGLLDPTAAQPRSNDDFVGWYSPAWCPAVRAEVRKDGAKYVNIEHHFTDGRWQARVEPTELTPLTDGLGFYTDRRQRQRMVYNEALRRYEIAWSGNYEKVGMPLARIEPDDKPPGEIAAVGIPGWH